MAGASAENGSHTPIAITAAVVASTTGAAVLWMNGIFSVRIMWTMSVCVSRPTTNHPDWNSDCSASVLAPNTCHMTQNVSTSKTELTGPMQTMNVAIVPAL